MKRTLLLLLASLLLAAPSARATDVGVDLHLRFGDPVPPPVVIAEPPVFLYPPALGFYAAVGVPYDCFFIDDLYYVYREGGWFVAPRLGGPWYIVHPRQLPPGLLKHRYTRVLELRDAEFSIYKGNRAGYKGKAFHPDRGGDGGTEHPGKGKGKRK